MMKPLSHLFAALVFCSAVAYVQSQNCTHTLDLVYVADGSASLGFWNFILIKQALYSSMQLLTLGQEDTRVGLVTFATSLGQTIPLTSDRTLLMTEINNLMFPDTGTYTNLAIDWARSELQTKGRPGVPQVLVVITDGQSEVPTMTAQAAQRARENGVQIYAIGVGDAIDVAELRNITADVNRVFLLSDFTLLNIRLQDITVTVCSQFATTTTTEMTMTSTSTRTTTPMTSSSTPTSTSTTMIRPTTTTPLTTSARTATTSTTEPSTFTRTTIPSTISSATTVTPAPSSTPTTSTPDTTRPPAPPTPPTGNDTVGHCTASRLVNGVGFLYDPSDCAGYIQCYLKADNSFLAVPRKCPLGQFWDQGRVTCDEACNVECPEDPCLGRNDGARRPMSGTCGGFWLCVNGQSRPRCCSHRHRYARGRGCVKDHSCTDPCGPGQYCRGSDNGSMCDKKPSWTDSHGFELFTDHSGWTPRRCTSGNFDIHSCSCLSASREERTSFHGSLWA